MARNQKRKTGAKKRKSTRKTSSRGAFSRRIPLRLVGWSLLYLALAAGVAFGGQRLYRLLLTHPSLQTKALVVDGASTPIHQALTEQLTPLIMGQNILSVDLDAVHAEAISHPWVAEASVYIQLPETLHVKVSERNPEGVVRRADALYLVDAEGRFICPLEDAHHLVDMPVIIGIDDKPDHRAAILDGLAWLSEIYQASEFFWKEVETLNIADDDNMVVHLRNVRAPIYLGDQLIAANLRHYLSIAEYIETNYPSLQYIELGFPNQVAIMPSQ